MRTTPVHVERIFRIALLLVLLSLLALGLFAQAPPVMKDEAVYVRLASENDFFKLRGNTDRYFTNGERLDVFFSSKYEAGLEKLFFVLPRRNYPFRSNEFGIGVGMNMYTPTDIALVKPDSTDRPYAGWTYAAIKCISNDFTTKQRLTTEHSLGVIGPAAGQKEVQIWYHALIGSQEPMGWDNQIANDFAYNLNVTYEKELIHPVRQIQVVGTVEANAGTVTNHIGLGGLIRIGRFNDYFVQEFGLLKDSTDLDRYQKEVLPTMPADLHMDDIDRKFQLYFQIRPLFRAVLDNSLLQGGMFGFRDSPHTVPADELKRFYVNTEYGLTLICSGFGITFTQSFRSPEFTNAKWSHWGGISIVARIAKGRR
ncbi:MAG: lipid A deacylase LpxR family protein [Flavobacteriales bacterium]|nr:MAG: lipid A deacylase LpxR family protein [Flavobacteriales bacterium]